MAFEPLNQQRQLESGVFRATAGDSVSSFVPSEEQEKPGFLQRAGTALKERIGEVKRTFGEAARGEITPAETGVRVVGDIAASVGDVFGAAVAPTVQKLAQTDFARPAFEKLAEGVDAYEDWKGSSNANRRIAEVVESVINISDLAGAGAAGKSVARKLVDVGGGVATTGRRAVSRVTKPIAERTQVARQVARDIIPSREQVINFQATRALDLTQGDVKNIANSTGNEVGEWLAQKNLIRNTKESTQEAVEELFGRRYGEVRDNINSVLNNYSVKSIPSYRKTLNAIKRQIDGVPGLEVDNKLVSNLLKKKTLKLADVQEAKELLDDHFSLYRATGDVKEGAMKEGIRNLRKDLRSFIEKEVLDNTGVDIKPLNNDVATSRGISEAITARSTRGLTRSSLTLGDIGTFGTGTAFGNPLFGAALVFGKKVIESPAVRLRFAKWMDKLSDAKKIKVRQDLKSGKVPTGLPEDIKKALELVPEVAGAGTAVGITGAVEEEITQ